MAHPLHSLLENVPKTAPTPCPPQPVADPPAATYSPDAPSLPTVGFEVVPGFTILAVREPRGFEGQPGAIHFAPFLSDRMKKDIKANYDWDTSFPVSPG